MLIRCAVLGDLDDIVRIDMTAFADESIRNYRYQHKDEYPGMFEQYLRSRYAQSISADNSIETVLVCELPNRNNPDLNQVVGCAVYMMPGSFAETAKPSANGSLSVLPATLQCGSEIRQRLFRQNQVGVKNAEFSVRYGDSQMYLGLLATDPAYQRKGIGAALCRWGQEKAISEGLMAVTLFSSLTGEAFYIKMGFRELSRFCTQVEGEEDFVDCPAMTWEVPKP